MADDFHSHNRHGRSPSHSSLIPDPFYSSNISPGQQQALLASILRELQEVNALNLRVASSPPDKYGLIWTLLLQSFAVTTGLIFGVFVILAWIASNHSNVLAAESLTQARNANSLASSANEMGSSANALAKSANAMVTSANEFASSQSYSQYLAQLTASYQADAANRMALLQYCDGVPKNSTAAYSLCSSAQSAAIYRLTYQVYSLFTELNPQSESSAAPSMTTTVSPITSTEHDASTSSTQANSMATATASSTGLGNDQSTASSAGLSSAEKAGIGVGASIGLLAFMGTLWFLLWRSYQYRENRARAFARSQFRGSESSFQQTKGLGGGGGVHVHMRETAGEARPLISVAGGR